MSNIKKLLSVTSAIIWSGITTISTQLPASANDVSLLCKNRNMATQIAINTEKFYAAICYSINVPLINGKVDLCDDPLDNNIINNNIITKDFYVGQSRKTGKSIILPAIKKSQEYSFGDSIHTIYIYKAQNGKYTYQIATNGTYRDDSWTSLSVFNNGKRTYHRKVNSYYGYYDC